MVFHDIASEQGLISDITFLLGVDINAYTVNDRTRNINERYRMVLSMIFESSGGWKFMDSNVSDVTTGVPFANQNLTSGTGLYALPVDALTVNAVSILNSGGNRENLVPITFEEYQARGGDATFSSNSVPHWYILQGDVLRLIPVPNYSSTNGIRVFFNQDISTFSPTDTTKTPGFASPFHRMLSVGASLDYAIGRGLTEKANYLQALWNDYEKRLRTFYVDRFADLHPPKLNFWGDLVQEFR